MSFIEAVGSFTDRFNPAGERKKDKFLDLLKQEALQVTLLDMAIDLTEAGKSELNFGDFKLPPADWMAGYKAINALQEKGLITRINHPRDPQDPHGAPRTTYHLVSKS